ncbi:E3 ubiquitin/ISG15 ligase TRIM25-like [Neoarius graeffei]|uniref:E3 ubiquitin/ISG15 ligase TRIM25-like n=1 Tax=Neoarius graeffei TaxID=443677 RepID=UPI00298C9F34|nr:E3 ubiquitin/ISG15 ligase TRIM25-like [Neoarius graeffei]
MAMSVFRDRDQYNCSVCLDLMKDPVTIPCGHSYCMSCIEAYWSQNQIGTTRCPQCRHEFPTRPALNKNTMLAEILEDLRTTTYESSLPALAVAYPGEVECDFCTGVKLRAVRSCLECRAAYCETHLQPHHDFPALRRHKLIVATRIPTCPRHDRLLEAFCRTDNTCICMSCVVDAHKGHDTVSSAAERDQKQVILQDHKCQFVEKRKEKEEALQDLQNAFEAHVKSAQQAVEDTQLAFSSLIASLEKSCTEAIDRIKAQLEIDKDRALGLQEQLELELAMLMGKEELIDKLLQTEDNIDFLQNFETMPSPSGDEEVPCRSLEPPISFSDASSMVSEFIENLGAFSKQTVDNMFANFHIKVGDRVRVKSSVNTPKFNWGNTVTHESVGLVKSISEETVIIDFPEHKNWKGLLSEMARVTAPDESVHIRVGDRVRVKSSVNEPTFEWGRVTHESVGVVTSVNDEILIADFPEYEAWKGLLSEMELVDINKSTGADESEPPPQQKKGKLNVKHRKYNFGKVLLGKK